MSSAVRVILDFAREVETAGKLTEEELAGLKTSLRAGHSDVVLKEFSDLLRVESGDVKVGTNSLKEISNALAKTGTLDVLKIEAKSANKEAQVFVDTLAKEGSVPDFLVEEETRILQNEKNQLLSLLEKETVANLNNLHAQTSAESLERIVSKLSAGDSKFAKLMSGIQKAFNVAKTAGVVVIAGIGSAVFLQWANAYMHAMSGPRLLLKNKKQLTNLRIMAPYPCGFSNKDGDVQHPLDYHIQSLIKPKSVCDDYTRFDSCGGWTTVGLRSRLFKLARKDYNTILKSMPVNSMMRCDHISFADALVVASRSLTKTIGKVIASAGEGFTEGLGFKISFQKIVLIFSCVGATYCCNRFVFASKLQSNQKIFVWVFVSLIASFLLFVVIYLVI